MTKDTDNEDVEFEPEADSDAQDYNKLLEKLAKLKEELKQCKEESKGYLDGWQRMRADVANIKKEQSGSMERMQGVLKEEIIADIIPILDSFDSAMQGEGWNDVSDSWRKGVEYIRSQCLAVLEKHGISVFGNPGDQFDHHIHEPIQEVEDLDAARNTLVRVARRGYKSGDRLIRPAQVVISK